MKTTMLGGVLASLVLVGCGGTNVTMDDVNGANANGAKFAVFADVVDAVDLDLDGNADLDISSMTVIISDQNDLCGAIEADPEALVNLPDLQAVQIFAFKVDNPGEGGFAEGDVLNSNAGILDILLDPAPGDVFIEGAALVRENGVDVVNAAGEALTDLISAGDGSLEIAALDAGVSLNADFSVTLASDIADPNTFDTDLDGDGVNDFLSINAALAATVKGATFCGALFEQ